MREFALHCTRFKEGRARDSRSKSSRTRLRHANFRFRCANLWNVWILITLAVVDTYTYSIVVCGHKEAFFSRWKMLWRRENVSQRNNCNAYNFITEPAKIKQMNEIVGLLMWNQKEMCKLYHSSLTRKKKESALCLREKKQHRFFLFNTKKKEQS